MTVESENQAVYTVAVTVLQARDLPMADVFGTSDSYAAVNIRGRNPADALKTKIMYQNVNPVWNETLTFTNVHPQDVLTVAAMDWDENTAHDVLGVFSVPFASMAAIFTAGGNRDAWFALDPPVQRGHVRLGFQISPNPPNMEADAKRLAPLHVSCKPMTSVPGVKMYVSFPGQKAPTSADPAVFFTGQPLRGNVHIMTDAPIALRSLNLKFSGKICGKAFAVSGSPSHLLTDRKNLLGSNSKNDHIQLFGGRHVYPFEVHLPSGLPSGLCLKPSSSSSEENALVHVKYSLTVDADIVDKPDIHIDVPVRIINPADTAEAHQSQEPKSLSVKKVPPFSTGAGPVQFDATLMRTALAPGQEIELFVQIDNKSSEKVKNIDVELIRVFVDGSGNGASRERAMEPMKIKLSTENERQRLVVDLPNNGWLAHSFTHGSLALGYELVFTVDIPRCRDICVPFPVRVLVPDGLSLLSKRRPEKSVESALATLDARPLQWTPLHVCAWAAYRVKVPAAASLFAELDLFGRELISITKDGFKQVLQSASDSRFSLSKDECEDLMKAHKKLVEKWGGVREFLRELGMDQYGDAFEREDMSMKELEALVDPKYGSAEKQIEHFRAWFSISVGAAIRLQHALEKRAKKDDNVVEEVSSKAKKVVSSLGLGL